MASTQTRPRHQAKTPTSRTKRASRAGKAARPPRAAGDPVTAYAKAVGTGKVVAGPHVRVACERHLRDLKEGPKRGLTWDLAAAKRVIGFFRDKLCVDLVAGDGPDRDSGAVKPFELLSFQAFIVGSLGSGRTPRASGL